MFSSRTALFAALLALAPLAAGQAATPKAQRADAAPSARLDGHGTRLLLATPDLARLRAEDADDDTGPDSGDSGESPDSPHPPRSRRTSSSSTRPSSPRSRNFRAEFFTEQRQSRPFP